MRTYREHRAGWEGPSLLCPEPCTRRWNPRGHLGILCGPRPDTQAMHSPKHSGQPLSATQRRWLSDSAALVGRSFWFGFCAHTVTSSVVPRQVLSGVRGQMIPDGLREASAPLGICMRSLNQILRGSSSENDPGAHPGEVSVRGEGSGCAPGPRGGDTQACPLRCSFPSLQSPSQQPHLPSIKPLMVSRY